MKRAGVPRLKRNVSFANAARQMEDGQLIETPTAETGSGKRLESPPPSPPKPTPALADFSAEEEGGASKRSVSFGRVAHEISSDGTREARHIDLGASAERSSSASLSPARRQRPSGQIAGAGERASSYEERINMAVTELPTPTGTPLHHQQRGYHGEFGTPMAASAVTPPSSQRSGPRRPIAKSMMMMAETGGRVSTPQNQIQLQLYSKAARVLQASVLRKLVARATNVRRGRRIVFGALISPLFVCPVVFSQLSHLPHFSPLSSFSPYLLFHLFPPHFSALSLLFDLLSHHSLLSHLEFLVFLV